MNELQKAWDCAIHKHNNDDIHDIHNALHVGNMQTQNHVIRECKDICTKEEIIQMNKTNNLQSKYNMELRDLINFLESKKSNFTIKHLYGISSMKQKALMSMLMMIYIIDYLC